VPELQNLAVDDIIPDGPRAADGFGVWRVRELSPPHAMVLESRRTPLRNRELPADPTGSAISLHVSWTFALAEMATRRSRLHVRVRARFDGKPWLGPIARAARVLFSLGEAVMEHTMLEGIRERAERRRAHA